MSVKPNHFKIGVFILSGIALFLIVLLALGARSYLEKKTTYETYFAENVDGLSIGAPVKLRGVPVGKVTHIAFTWNKYPTSKEGYVLVEFEVKESTSLLPPDDKLDERLKQEIAKGLRIRIKNQGITGLSFLSIEYASPLDNPELAVGWKPESHYIPSIPAQFDQLLAAIEKGLHKIDDIDVKAINCLITTNLASMQVLMGSMQVLVEQAQKQASQLDLGKLSTNVNDLVGEVRSTLGGMKTMVTNIDGTISRMELEQLGRNTSQMIAEMTRVSERLNYVISTVDATPLNETLVNARVATENLNDVLRDLKQYPSSFIFGGAPPPAKSVIHKTK